MRPIYNVNPSIGRIFFALLLVFYSVSSSADYFTNDYAASSGVQYNSVQEACYPPLDFGDWQFSHIQEMTIWQWNCIFDHATNSNQQQTAVGRAYRILGACPNGGTNSVDENGFPACTVEQCPYGTIDIGSQGNPNCVDICPVGAVEVLTANLTETGGTHQASDGCEYTFTELGHCAGYISGPNITSSISCVFKATATGNFDDANVGNGTLSATNNAWTPPQDSDQTTSTSSSTTNTSTPVTNPDGSVTETQTDTTTNTQGTGTSTEYTPPTTQVHDSTGSTEISSTSTATTSNTDGSSIVQTTDTNTFNDGNTTTYEITNSTGETVVTTVNNYDNSTQIVTTQIYDTNGDLVSTDITSENTQGNGVSESGDGDGEKEGNCGGEGQPDCDVRVRERPEDFQFSDGMLNGIEDTFDDALSNELDTWDNIDSDDFGVSAIDDFNAASFIQKYFTMPSSNCSGSINTSIFGRAFVLDPCVKLQPLRDVLAWVFFITAALLILNIILGRKII